MTALTLAEYTAARRAEDLEHLLIVWHNWSQSAQIARGYRETSAGTGLYQASRQYDDVNGVLDDDIDAERCKVVQFHVENLPPIHRIAIYILARNLTTGRSVWMSPRLPHDKAERERVVTEARDLLTARLVSAGLIE